MVYITIGTIVTIKEKQIHNSTKSGRWLLNIVKSIRKKNIKWKKFLTYMGLTIIILFVVLGTKNLTVYIREFNTNEIQLEIDEDWLFPKNYHQFASLSIWQPPKGQILDIHVQDKVFFVLTSEGDLFFLNYNNPMKPEVLSKIASTKATKIFVYDDYLYTSSPVSGITIYDIAKIRNPRERFHFALENNFIYNFVIKEQYAFIAKGSYGLEIIDLSDKLNPRSVVDLNFEKEVQDILIHESYLFLAVKQLINSNQNTTSFLNPLDDTIIEGDIYGNGLVILDIKNIFSPKLVSYHFERSNELKSYLGLSIDEDFVHLVDGKSGFKIIDIKNINRPRVLGQFVEDEYYIDLVTDSKYTFISTYEQGLQVFDTSIKTQPRKIAQYFIRSPTIDLYLGNSFASIANQKNGLITLDFDKDKDEINDLLEISEFNTNPNSQDTDSDQLNDHDELFIFGTDPTLKDTDMDSFTDSYEIQRNHDPLDPEDHPIYFSIIALLTLSSILVFIMLSFRFEVVVAKAVDFKRKVRKKRLAIRKNNELRLLKLLYCLKSNENYSLKKLADAMCISIGELVHLLNLLQVKGSIERVGEINFQKNIFTRKVLETDYMKNKRCYYCNSRLSDYQIFCKKCKNNKFFCKDCYQLIGYKEPIGVCPICLSNFHLEHILTHVLVVRCCPVCQYEIYLKEIAVIIPLDIK